MTAVSDTSDSESSVKVTEEVASRARFQLYLVGGCGQLVSLFLIVGCGIYCHFVPGINPTADAVAFGVSMSLINLAALWSALGPLRLFTRVPLAILLVAAIALMLIVFAALDDVDNEHQMSLVLLLVPPMMTAQFAGTTACFLLLRRTLNRRIGLVAAVSPTQRADAQFGIRHLLLWMTGIALLVGGFRLIVFALVPKGLTEIAFPISDILLQIAIFLLFNTILTVPIPWAVLGGGRSWIRVPIAFVFIGATTGVQHLVYSTLWGIDRPGLLYLAVQVFSATFILTINLLIVRLCGYRLVPDVR